VLDTETSEVNPKKAFVLLQTSGTSGKPKGVLYTREAAIIGLRSQAETFNLSSADTWLQTSPLHWGAGFTLAMITLFSGGCVEFRKPDFNARWLVDRLGAGGITFVYIAPFLLDEIADMLAESRSPCSDSNTQAALRGIREVRVLCTGAMRVNPLTLSTWKGLRGGKPPMVVYAMTESISLVATTDWKSDTVVPQVSQQFSHHIFSRFLLLFLEGDGYQPIVLWAKSHSRVTVEGHHRTSRSKLATRGRYVSDPNRCSRSECFQLRG
jgi:acyl-CoA synthetase (AMP-forming)/AMP-acid ligase II